MKYFTTVIPQSHRVATYDDHSECKSLTVAASRSVVAAQLPSCGHTETQIATDCSAFCAVLDMQIVRLY